VEEREERGMVEYQTLIKKYTEVQGQCAHMEGTLTDLTQKFDEVKANVLTKEEMVEARHATKVEVTKEQHADEIQTQQSGSSC
jgi:t-SNARE complex subunit (syntaxin)